MSIASMLNTKYYSENEHLNYTLPTNTYYPLFGLRDIQVEHNGREFCIITTEGLECEVPRSNLSHELRGISTETLQKMLKVGYLTINKAGDNFTIQYKGRLLGGGPVTGVVVFLAGTSLGWIAIIGGSMTANPALIAAGVAIKTAAPIAGAAATGIPGP